MEVTSEAFKTGQPIPNKYTRDDGNVSPPLTWKGAPSETREYVVICEDPDAPGYQPWIHWLVWGIPGENNSIAEGDASSFKEGKNSNGEIEYTGPMPPPGHGEHHYHFKVFALDEPLRLKRGANRDEVLKAMEGHVIDQGEIVGVYTRK
jgi:Raf kinase inhibitor-like YbhB/YbcL family protein